MKFRNIKRANRRIPGHRAAVERSPCFFGDCAWPMNRIAVKIGVKMRNGPFAPHIPGHRNRFLRLYRRSIWNRACHSLVIDKRSVIHASKDFVSQRDDFAFQRDCRNLQKRR